MTLPPDALLDQLRWRYAVKKYDPAKKIPADVWAKVEDALVLSPSSYGHQPWKFVVVTDPEVRAKLRPVAYNQPQVTDASHLVVFCVKTGMGLADVDRFVRRNAEVRGVPVETLDGFKQFLSGAFTRQSPAEIDEWMTRQVYIAVGVFVVTLAVLGIDAGPMEGFEPDKFDDILGLKAGGYHAVVIAGAGYRAADDKYAAVPKVRYPKDEVIEHV